MPLANSSVGKAGSEPVEAPQVSEEEAVSPPPAVNDTPGEKKGKGLFARLKSGLSKTRKILTTDIDDLFLGK